MNTKDITKEQMETLVLIRSLEEFIADKPNEFDSLAEAVSKLDEGLSMKDGKQFISDIKDLTEKGYLISNAGDIDESIEGYKVPTVEGITQKGKSALDEWEREFKGSISNGKKEKVTIINNYNINNNNTVNNSLFHGTDSIFSILAKTILKGVIHK